MKNYIDPERPFTFKLAKPGHKDEEFIYVHERPLTVQKNIFSLLLISKMIKGIQRSGQRVWKLAGGLVLGLLLVIGVLTLPDYGMTWDEQFRFEGGDAKLDYYQAWFAGEEPAKMSDSYPGLFDLPLAWVHELFPGLGTRSEKGHAYSLFFGLLGLLAAWRTTARIGGERAGFWALILLAALPRYYGHMFFNPKDIPLAATYMVGVWALVALFQKMPAPPWRSVVWVGLAAGFAMSTRIAGFLILCYFGLFVGLYLLGQYGRRLRALGCDRKLIKDAGRDLLRWALRGALAGAVALLPLYIFWPALHGKAGAQLVGTAERVQNFGWSGWVLMDGKFYEAADLPFYYIPYWLFRTTPELLLILLGVAVFASFALLRKWEAAKEWPLTSRWLPALVLVFSAAFPLVYLFVTDPVLYDGIRHFLFVLPPMVCFAALGLEFAFRASERRGTLLVAGAIQAGLGLGVALLVYQMVSLHPYQYIYFNHLGGGLPGAYMRDDTDYWGASHKEAAEWLQRYVDQIDPEGEQTFRVHQRYSRWMLGEHLDPTRFEITPERQGADFYVSTTRFNLHASYPEAQLLFAVERQGVPLCFVFRFPD